MRLFISNSANWNGGGMEDDPFNPNDPGGDDDDGDVSITAV